MRSWLEKNALEMYSAENKRKNIVAERNIRSLEKQNLKEYDFNIKKCVYCLIIIQYVYHVMNKYA